MENIALAFSGGGFRAACFSLGCLSYLNRIHHQGKPLLKNVTFISSTSGGSITNLVYSSFLFKGKDFDACYRYLFAELDGEKLITRALDILKNKKVWKDRPLKSRNLINAFSMAYDVLLEAATLNVYGNRTHQPHLEEICVNSTEFTNGLAFRFQSQHPDATFPKGKIGNNYIFFKRNSTDVGNRLKLSDILASSSCFPSGFEPMIFPNDYAHKALTAEELREAISFKANTYTLPPENELPETGDETSETVIPETEQYNRYDLLEDENFIKKIHFGIMDGGVADNQAIDAFKLANKRRKENDLPEFDLFMACDVTSYFMDGYTLPLGKNKWYNRLNITTLIAVWVLCCLALPALFIIFKNNWKPWMYITATVSGMMALPLLLWRYKKLKQNILLRRKKNFSGVAIKKYSHIFLRLNLGTVKQMLAARIKSVFILANDVYLKQIRRLYYERLFNDDAYKNRVILNSIYKLSKVKFPAEDISTEALHPSEKIIEVAEKARTMATTLWFDETHKAAKIKEAIIATGQFTTCYSLLQHLQKQEEAGVLTPQLQELKIALMADWEGFCMNPMMMI
jgi:Patatin-like phospholipase